MMYICILIAKLTDAVYSPRIKLKLKEKDEWGSSLEFRYYYIESNCQISLHSYIDFLVHDLDVDACLAGAGESSLFYIISYKS
jgi:hypothetical protein